jgi:enoyl-CoA hydratase
MGGGIGLSGHARFRIATERSRFAMPEAAIGFFCDVGSNFILSRQPRHRALAFEFAGEPVGAADAVMLRLTDIVVPSSSLDALTGEIARAAADEDPEHAIAGVLTPHAGDIGPIPFCEGVDRLALCFEGDDVGQMLDALSARAAENEFAGHLADTIGKRCPTSLVANLQALDASRTMKTAGDVLALDYRLAVYLTRRGDFAEGVRAVLVDKDHSPAWSPADLSGVDGPAIAAAIAGD